MQYVWYNIGIPVYSSHFSLHFDSISCAKTWTMDVHRPSSIVQVLAHAVYKQSHWLQSENIVMFRYIPGKYRDIPWYSVIFRHIPWYSAIFRDIPAFRVFTTPLCLWKTSEIVLLTNRLYGCQILNNSILAIYGFVFESQAKLYCW